MNRRFIFRMPLDDLPTNESEGVLPVRVCVEIVIMCNALNKYMFHNCLEQRRINK